MHVKPELLLDMLVLLDRPNNDVVCGCRIYTKIYSLLGEQARKLLSLRFFITVQINSLRNFGPLLVFHEEKLEDFVNTISRLSVISFHFICFLGNFHFL